jgi:hypothetical protein
MRAFALAIPLILTVSTLSFAQAPPTHKPQTAARSIPKPSPAELRRCALSPKLLNATARSACRGYPRKRH